MEMIHGLHAGVLRKDALTGNFTGLMERSNPIAVITRLLRGREKYMIAHANARRSAAVLVLLVLSAIAIVGIRLAPVSATVPALINCTQHRPQIRVRSSNDNKIYTIDVCAVADSASGEDFRTEAK